jgi:hypothetical protein
MKVKGVYPMVVNVRPLADHLRGIKSHTPTLEIRPVIPGAQVTPSHYELEMTGSTPAFYVTPVARGRLADARLEVYSHGRLVQEIPTPMRGTWQRPTWVLLFLTVLIPLGIYYFTKHVDLSSMGASVQSARAPAKSQAGLEDEEDLDAAKPMDPEEGLRIQKMMAARMGAPTPPSTAGKAKKEEPKKEAPKVEGPPQEPKPVLANSPKPKGPIEQATIKLLPDFPSIGTWTPAGGAQEVYDWSKIMASDYLSFYVGLGLLALTLLSWVLHAARRSSRRGQPIALGA